MKIAGQELQKDKALFGPVLIRRGESLHAIYAQPVWSFVEFHKACPEPEPPVTAFAPKKPDGSGGKTRNVKDPKYLAALDEHAARQWGYLTLKSLEPSDLELDGVSLDKPETWGNVEQALRYDADKNPNGLSHFEFAQVMRLVDEANMLDQAKIDENLESFFRGQAQPEGPSENGQAG